MLVTSSAIDGVRDAVDAAVAAHAPGERSDAALLNDTEMLLVAIRRLEAMVAGNLAVMDARQVTTVETGRGTRAWLVEEQLLDAGPAARTTAVSRQLWRWPATEAAWRAGEISEGHVAVIFRALRTVPAGVAELVEKTLLEIARDSCPALVARAVDAILVACGIDKDSDAAAARRYGERGFTIARTFGGTGSAAGTLTAELTSKLLAALEHAGQPAGPDDDRTRAQRGHDALEAIVDHFLDTSSDIPDQVNGERPARVIVTIPLEVLERRLADAWGLLPEGIQVSPETARRLACDAEVIPAVLGGRSVLDLGAGQRLFSEPTRRAAVLRDGDHCVYPACQNPRRHAHHIVHWADGGPSTLDNCAWLCTYHHRLVHEAGWTLRREDDGGYTFTSPTGRQRTSSHQPTDPDPPWG